MALRFSPALQNFVAETGSWKSFFDNGHIIIYTGAQPATPDLAPTGTALVTLTSSAGAKTNETSATGVVTLTGSSGTLDTLTIAGVEIMGSATAFNTSLTQTAADVCLKVNRNPANWFVTATNVLGVITLTALPGFMTALNSKALAATTTTLTATITSTSFGSGTGGSVAGIAAANGLLMDYNAAAGVFSKNSTQTWSGAAASTGTAGWFRYYSSVLDSLALDSSAIYMRMDGSVATSGSQMNMSSTTITSPAVQTLSTFSVTIPAS